MDNELTCNFRKCRKRVDSFAWVTSCTHIFCDEDGTRIFGKSHACPACDATLTGKFDIIRIDLNPTEQYKSMVLAGQKPEVVMEIASRAVSFWNYQIHQERMYQEHVCSKAKEKVTQLQQHYTDLLTRTQTEMNSLKTQITATKKEMESVRKKYNEVTDQLNEKGRLYGKLQTMYDALRRRSVTPNSFDHGDGHVPILLTPRHVSDPFTLSMATRNDVLGQAHSSSDNDVLRHVRPVSPAEREFALRPISTPVLGDARRDFLMGFDSHRKK